MTEQDTRNRVTEIEDNKHDDEAAHSLEDKLYLDVLRQLAEQGNTLAAEAIKASDIEFARWCA
jgi:hypothetical protein